MAMTVLRTGGSCTDVIVSSAPFLSNCNLGSLLENIDIGNGKTPTAAICSHQLCNI